MKIINYLVTISLLLVALFIFTPSVSADSADTMTITNNLNHTINNAELRPIGYLLQTEELPVEYIIPESRAGYVKYLIWALVTAGGALLGEFTNGSLDYHVGGSWVDAFWDWKYSIKWELSPDIFESDLQKLFLNESDPRSSVMVFDNGNECRTMPNNTWVCKYSLTN